MTLPDSPGSMTPAYTLTRNASLARRNTLRVAAQAELLVELSDPASLPELLQLESVRDRPLLVLGEGSNVLFAGNFEGVVLIVSSRGKEIVENGEDGVRIRAAAGEHWHDLVRWSLAEGLSGLENLSLIPGSVGAAPIQNIGAYGVELADSLTAVEAYDRERAVAVRFDREQCEFGYRQSIFKQHPGRWIITAVELLLQREAALSLDYAGVRDELSVMGIAKPSATDVSDAVCRLRRRKLPDPAEIGNAGSFFKNPVVGAAAAAKLQERYPKLPVFDAPGGKKLSAAWLIEQCGWKGFREHDAGVSEKHSLVLVNYGAASGAELKALAQRIMDSVRDTFAVQLEPEPRIIP